VNDIFGLSDNNTSKVLKKTGIGSHQSANMGKDEWLTPPEIIASLGPFDLDPCSPINRPWDTAKKHYTINDDGLSLPWNGFVWCNPPYGSETGKWLSKMANHNNGIALIFARTETKMFFDYGWDRSSSMLFIKDRLYFYHVNGTKASNNSGAPSVLIGYGEMAKERLKLSKIPGRYVENTSRIGY